MKCLHLDKTLDGGMRAGGEAAIKDILRQLRPSHNDVVAL